MSYCRMTQRGNTPVRRASEKGHIPGVNVTVAPPAGAATAPFLGALVSPPVTAPAATVHRPLGEGGGDEKVG